MTITLHPVAGWAWIVVAGVVAIGLLLGLLEALKGDEIPGWVETALFLVTQLLQLTVAAAAVLTATSFIFT